MVQSVGNMALRRLGKCCRSLLNESHKGAFCGVLRPGWIESCIGAKRHLLSDDVIKLQEFQLKKLSVAHLAVGPKGKYIDVFSQKLQRNELILRDELKLLLHLCQSSDDMLVVKDGIYRYYAENHNIMHGDFRFGPLFMRLCYELGLEGLAAVMITDKNLTGFFPDSTSFNIAIDMLFMKGSYESALEVLRTMKNQGIPFNKDTLILATGTCYKLDTAESFNICNALLEHEKEKRTLIPRHAYCFAVALALRRNDLETAQSFYSQIMNTDGRLCQNLEVLLLAMSGEMTQAISILSAALLPKSPYFVKKLEFSVEVVNLLRLRSEQRPYMMEVEQTVTQLEEAGQVTEQTLDDMLCRTPTGKRKQGVIMKEKIISKRTLKPLKYHLLSD
ncbi:pentatricopeptide repeat-containing protein 2, mitochondrial [Stegastes partitus]|uniref:Pentatricopeptide repeat-containing protein 2, mitochondrial n=1 Tax=Stegastes partitus TaxID=144197 RepID=A0A3B5ACJ4_9TELE|nr:PREDICTED: pentatricopeptide repeat-containing protein 2, mitochondrial [Stegastes partitus]